MSVVWGTARPSRSLCECRHEAFAVVRILRTGRRNMPSARTPHPSSDAPNAAPGTPPSTALWPAAPAVAAPVASAPAPTAAAPAGLVARESVAQAVSPVAFGGLRLIEVPGDWPPYDCEVHGTKVRVVSGVQCGPCRRRGGPGHCMVQAVRPGNRRNPGRRPVAETARPLDDRTRPGTDRPAQPDPDAWSEARDPAHRDLAARGARGGDDRRAQLRAAKPRTGAASGACAAPPARAGASRSPGAMALHRNRDRLAAASPFRAWMPRSCRSPSAVPLRFTLIVGGRRMPGPEHVMLPRSWQTAVTRDPWPPTGPAPLIRRGCRLGVALLE
jgi:hypothetical protein